jgi:hypothetical protein
MREPFVQALDDRCVTSRSLGLGEPEEYAETDEEHENEDAAEGESLDGADDQLNDVAHASPS